MYTLYTRRSVEVESTAVRDWSIPRPAIDYIYDIYDAR